MIRHFANMSEGVPFTLDHLIRMYSHRMYRGILIKLKRRAPNAFFSYIDKGKDKEWMSLFVRVRTSDLIPFERMPFLEDGT